MKRDLGLEANRRLTDRTVSVNGLDPKCGEETRPRMRTSPCDRRRKVLWFLQFETVQAEIGPSALGIGILTEEIDAQLDSATHWRDLP